MTEIKINHVSAFYGKTAVLNDISLTIGEGERVLIGGPNGAGKTTLLRVMAKLLPYEGTVTLAGEDADKMKRRDIASLVALMPQTNEMYFAYTVRQTVLLGRYARMRGLLSGPSKTDCEIADKCLDDCGVYEYRDRLLSELSGGQLQRVLLARTFAQGTPYVLLDEPGNNLDIKYRSELTDYLNKWSDGSSEYRGTSVKNTLVGVFHDLGQSASCCSRGVFLKEGIIASDCAVPEIFKSNAINEIYGFDVISYKREESRFWNS